MRVLIVHPSKGFHGGAEEVVDQLCKYLFNNGHEVILVAKDAPFWEDTSWSIICNSYRRMWYLVKRSLDTGWVDIINVHNFPATLMHFPSRKPVVWMCNEPPELFTNWKRKPIEAFNRWWVRRSGMKCVVADEMQAVRFKSIYGVEPKVIPYGIDYNFWSQGERTNKGFILLQVGHPEFFPEGQEILQRVKRFIPSAELIQVSGESREYVRERYYEASILIHPIGAQGGWLVPFEAMCAGLPVIVSHWFTGAGIIYKNSLGIVDFDIASCILAKVYGKIDAEKTKGWVKENLTWEKFGEGMVKVFEEALKCK